MRTDTQPTTAAGLEAALADLATAAPRLASVDPRERARLGEACLGNLAVDAAEWTRITCAAKGLDPLGPWAGEEQALGPMAAARYLRLAIATLDAVGRQGRPELPGEPRLDEAGRLRVPVMPTRGLFDGLAFKGFHAEVIMRDGVTGEVFADRLGRAIAEPHGGVSVVLGAGNVSFIAVGDMLAEVLLAGRVALVKLHDHFAGLSPLLERVFAPLIRPGYVRIVAGDAGIGAAAVDDDRVGRVRLTGSAATFRRVVWGDATIMADELPKDRRHLRKDVIAELGNVTPWIVVPGPWSDAELRYQAENLAGAIASNGSFNCICPRVIVTSRGWPQRERFLDLLRMQLATVAPRPAFYSGAVDRYLELVGEPAGVRPGHLPWTLLLDADPDTRPELFTEENFLPVSAETALESADAAAFLDEATRFVNDRVSGNLAATVVIRPSQRKDPAVASALDASIQALRYGTVCVNQFAGYAYLLMCTPWGAYPGGTFDDPQSGLGFTNNTYGLDGVEKTVFEGPFRVSPKPMHFPSNRNSRAIAGALTDLYLKPTIARVPRLLFAALRG